MMSRRWRHRPEGANWGDFGDDDRIGRLNLLTPERVRRAAEEVKEGRAFCLSLPLDLPGGSTLNPHRHPPRLLAAERRPGASNYLFALGDEKPGATDVLCDDAVLLFTQYSTQWDALGHVGQRFDADGDGVAEHVFYNGWRAPEDFSPPSAPGPDGLRTGAKAHALGIDRMAETAVQGRGVLVDLRHHRCPRGGGAVGGAELLGIMAADGAAVEPGDILCLRTGFAELLIEMEGRPDHDQLHAGCAVLDGRDPALLDWISRSGVAAIAADNYAVEAYPARPCEAGRDSCAALPLHEHCLFKLGLPLGELWHFGELAGWLRAAGRSRFLLTAPPLRLPGAVGSPVTPVATV
jgi:kynurenine formamidase